VLLTLVRLAVLLVSVAVGCAATLPLRAEAQDDASAEQSVVWLVRPSAEVFSLFFPPHALAQGIEGAAILDCEARLDQRLDCDIESETPVGWGFGAAAVGVSRSFRARPMVRDGVPVGDAHTRVPVNFPIAGDAGDTWPGVPELPYWEAAPPPSAVDDAWNRVSRARDARGRAVLSCVINENRGLNCTLVHESAPGFGFGEAALALAPAFRVSASSVEFTARYRERPFLLPINFGFDPRLQPISIVTTGLEPIEFPTPPREIVDRIYPPAARAAGISGSVTVTCTAQADLSLDCRAANETPAGHGFGDAAVALMSAGLSAAITAPSPFIEGDRVVATIPFDVGPR
jgi:hypothetical protein